MQAMDDSSQSRILFPFRSASKARPTSIITQTDKHQTPASTQITDMDARGGVRDKLRGFLAVFSLRPNRTEGSPVSKIAQQSLQLTTNGLTGHPTESTTEPSAEFRNGHPLNGRPTESNPTSPIDNVTTIKLSPRDKLKSILGRKLKKDEYEDIFRELNLSAQSVAESLAEELKLRAEGPGIEQKNKQKDRILIILGNAVKTGGVAIEHHPDVAALAWERFQTLLQVTISDMEMKKSMERAEQAIVAALDLCALYEGIYASSVATQSSKLGTEIQADSVEDSIIEIYATVIIFCIKLKQYLEHPTLGQSAIDSSIGINIELQILINEIEAKGILIQKYGDMENIKDHSKQFQDLEAGVADIQSHVSEILVEVESMRAETQIKDLRDSRIWLGGLESYPEYEKNRKSHAIGTCEWILGHDVFRGWMNAPGSTLLIHGISGAGKSVLSAFILEKLRHLSPRNSQGLPSPIIHFFFKNGNPKTESPITMVATLIDQLAQQHPTPKAAGILKNAKKRADSQYCGDFEQLWCLFVKLVQVYQHEDKCPITILIDGLDECAQCEDRSKLLEYIRGETAFDWKALGVRFLLLSRPEEDIMQALKSSDMNSNKLAGGGCMEIQLNSRLVKKDIVRFVQGKTTTTKYKVLQPLRQKLIKTLPEKSEGTFRYAALMLDQLLMPSQGKEKTFYSIPAGLNNMYVYILEHLGSSPDEFLLRKTVFAWVALAFRPLSVYEMALAYAGCNDGDDDGQSDTDFDPSKKRLINEQDILRACGPLVEIAPNGTLAFTHFSVKEFLLVSDPKERKKNTPYNGQSLVSECLIRDLGIAHGGILKICMSQLLSKAFLESLATLDKTATRTIYSIAHGISHAMQKDVQHLNSTQTQPKQHQMDPWPIVCRFLSNSNTSFAKWIAMIPPLMPSFEGTCLFFKSQHRPEDRALVRPLHVIACFNLQIPLAHALEDENLGKSIDSHDVFGKSPLAWAAERGYTEIVKMLLEKNADLEIKDNQYGQSPLSVAAKWNHTEVIKLLLEKNADLETKDNLYGSTPLSWAAQNGHTEAVKILLEKNADMETRDYLYNRTPLSWATLNGHAEVVKVFLEKNADVDAEDVKGRTPLSLAAGNGHTELVKLLLEKNADTNKNDGDGQTPLFWAVGNGYTEITKLLLEKNAETGKKDSKYCQTPLSWAAENGRTSIVGLLMGKNVDIEEQDVYGRTALSWAAGNGHVEVVKILLEKNADIEARDANSRAPLSWAAGNGHAEIVQLLIGKGVYIETKDVYNRTPLFRAAGNGHFEVVKMLLEKNADKEAEDMYGQTAQSWAAQNGRASILKALLAKNVAKETRVVNDM